MTTLFGPILGGDLPLLHTPPARLAKLSGQLRWDFEDQLRHQCIRRAWAVSAHSGEPVRDLLDIFAGKASIAYAQARGWDLFELAVDMDLQHARRENEWWTCFGFYLDDHIERITRNAEARRRGLDSLGWKLHQLEGLRRTWGGYRDGLRSKPLSRQTVHFVQGITGRNPYATSCDPLDAYIDLARMALAVIEAA